MTPEAWLATWVVADVSAAYVAGPGWVQVVQLRRTVVRTQVEGLPPPNPMAWSIADCPGRRSAM